ncbi:hypothetical protein Tcan_01190, partial [Toxocara canis]
RTFDISKRSYLGKEKEKGGGSGNDTRARSSLLFYVEIFACCSNCSLVIDENITVCIGRSHCSVSFPSSLVHQPFSADYFFVISSLSFSFYLLVSTLLLCSSNVVSLSCKCNLHLEDGLSNTLLYSGGQQMRKRTRFFGILWWQKESSTAGSGPSFI